MFHPGFPLFCFGLCRRRTPSPQFSKWDLARVDLRCSHGVFRCSLFTKKKGSKDTCTQINISNNPVNWRELEDHYEIIETWQWSWHIMTVMFLDSMLNECTIPWWPFEADLGPTQFSGRQIMISPIANHGNHIAWLRGFSHQSSEPKRPVSTLGYQGGIPQIVSSFANEMIERGDPQF